MFSILYSFITFTKPYDKLKIKFYDSSDFPWPQHQAPEHQHKAPLIQGLSMPLD